MGDERRLVRRRAAPGTQSLEQATGQVTSRHMFVKKICAVSLSPQYPAGYKSYIEYLTYLIQNSRHRCIYLLLLVHVKTIVFITP